MRISMTFFCLSSPIIGWMGGGRFHTFYRTKIHCTKLEITFHSLHLREVLGGSINIVVIGNPLYAARGHQFPRPQWENGILWNDETTYKSQAFKSRTRLASYTRLMWSASTFFRDVDLPNYLIKNDQLRFPQESMFSASSSLSKLIARAYAAVGSRSL